MLSLVEALTVIWVLTTGLQFVVFLTDDRWQKTTEGITLATGRSILAGFLVVAVPTVVVLGMDAITPLTTLRGRTLPDYFGDVAAVIVAATGLYVAAVLSRYQQTMPDDDAPLSAVGQRDIIRILGVTMAATGFL